MITYADFEQSLRKAICDSANELHQSGMSFAVFSDTKCNSQYWDRTSNGGWRLKEKTTPSEAVRDIFANGWKYATECATAMMIVYYKSVLEVYGDELFDRVFTSIYLMDWEVRNPLLSSVGRMSPVDELLVGDRGYFTNPDHDPTLPQWQGENVIILGDDSYYGHGIGLTDSESIINALNSRRKGGLSDNLRNAYLMSSAGRPDFKKLADVMRSGESVVTVWSHFPSAVPVMAIPGKRGTSQFV